MDCRFDLYDLSGHDGPVAKVTASEGTRTIADVKAHLAECIREAEAGRIIIVSRHGRPVAQLGPVRELRHGAERHQPDEVAEKTLPFPDEHVALPTPAARRGALRALLEEEIWPRIPQRLLGKGVTKQEREEILGYAPSTGASKKDRTHGGR
jgi:prevent-host-death family protein